MVLSRFRDGFAAGVKATGAMSIPMLLATVSGMSPMPRPIPLAIVRKVLGADAPKPVLAVAAAVAHVSYGGTWAGLLASTSPDGSVEEGVGLGIGLWGLLGVVLMPWLGWGRFGRKISSKVAPAALFLHLVYGTALGRMLEGGRSEDRSTRQDEPSAPSIE